MPGPIILICSNIKIMKYTQLKCPSVVFVLGARGMTLQWGSTPKLLPVGTVVIWPTKS